MLLHIVIQIRNHKNIHIPQCSDSHCSYNEIMIYIICVKSSDIFLQSGSTPLHAAASQRGNEQVIKTLIKAGADVNATDAVSYYRIIV